MKQIQRIIQEATIINWYFYFDSHFFRTVKYKYIHRFEYDIKEFIRYKIAKKYYDHNESIFECDLRKGI